MMQTKATIVIPVRFEYFSFFVALQKYTFHALI